MSALAHDARMVRVLWERDVRLFVRQKSRVAAALAQPLLFWLVFGSGMAPAFRIPETDIGYLAYTFPGVLVMLLLFAAISATMSIIEDRHQGFLQGVLAAPGSRPALVAGKSLGSATVAVVQALLFAQLAPLAGFPWSAIAWPSLIAALTLTAFAMTALGFSIAWALDSTQGYHVVMSVALIPLWVLSGALFPPAGLPPVLAQIVALNPFTYSVTAIRRALHGGILPNGTGLATIGRWGELAIVAAFASAAFGVAVWVASRRPARG